MFEVFATMDQRLQLSRVEAHAQRAEALGFHELPRSLRCCARSTEDSHDACACRCPRIPLMTAAFSALVASMQA